jgi:hypothetical protein
MCCAADVQNVVSRTVTDAKAAGVVAGCGSAGLVARPPLGVVPKFCFMSRNRLCEANSNLPGCHDEERDPLQHDVSFLKVASSIGSWSLPTLRTTLEQSARTRLQPGESPLTNSWSRPNFKEPSPA